MNEIFTTFVVTPLLQEALSRFRDATRDLENDVAELKQSLTMTQSLLEAAEEMEERNVAIESWLQKVESAAYDVVKLLDQHDYEVHQQKVENPRKFMKQVHNLLSHSKSMPGKIKKLKESLDSIEKDSSMITQLFALRKVKNLSTPNETILYPDNSEVLGREHDVSKIVGLLRADSSREHRLSVLSIVGMPGVGKTALANSIFSKVEKEKLFGLMAWVCLSDGFDGDEILNDMLETLDCTASRKKNSHALRKWLKKKLANKKFLLVLDDVWNEDPVKWKNFFSALLHIGNTTGNFIVVTTSNEKVVASASETGTIPIHKHELQKLSNEECWLIMEKNILGSSEIAQMSPDLLDIGTDIAQQCGGLPLVAAVIGEKLRQNIDAEEWSAIRSDTAWHAPHRSKILSELKKSFRHLPSHLKKCFSYCSIFPKGSEIRGDDLVQLWMARGFLHQFDDSKSEKEEDIGIKYLNALVSNYLFQDVERDDCGHIKSCKMHDEVHNLALSISKCETYIWPDTRPIEVRSRIQHMRVMSDRNLQDIPADVARRLQSLFLEVDVLCTKALNPESLQSLKVAAVDREKLEESLGKLKYYMKYLDISGTEIQELPDSITRLYNLQTLRFMGCNSLMELPSGIENLVSLRHFYFDEGYMPSSIGKLTSLYTLPLFVVGTEEGQKIKELARLNQLRGKLKICNLEKVSQSEANEAKLEDKGELTELQFVWSENRANSDNDMGVLEGLRPHSNLKSLTIENYKGINFPSWMVKDARGSTAPFQLNSLVKLELIDCDGYDDISCLELLPELTVLNIKAMPKVKRIGRMFYHQGSSMASSSQGGGQSITPFPSLRKLNLSKMTQLEEWTGELQGVAVFPCLEELHIQDCPKLKTWWASTSQGGGQSITPFPLLRKLKLSNMTQLEEWTGALQGKAVFPCLEELHIQDCPKLETWWASSSQGGGESILPFPALRKLMLSKMTKLEGWKTAQAMIVFSCLEELHIGDCPELKTWCASSSQSRGDAITPFPALRKLTLSNMTKLEKWTEAQDMIVFPCLHELRIEDCSELKTWWGDGFASPNLSILSIQSCPNLQAIPNGLSNLTFLDINNCPKLMGYAKEGSREWKSICYTCRIRFNGQMVRCQRS